MSTRNDFTKPGTVLRVAEARYVGSSWPKLQGEEALLMLDPNAPWFVLAQFTDTRFKYWSHGWHPMPRSSFDGLRVQHAFGADDDVCRACGKTAEQVSEEAIDDCQVMELKWAGLIAEAARQEAEAKAAGVYEEKPPCVRGNQAGYYP